MSEFNVIVAGVGGQGILTIASLIARAAIGGGLQVKQSEVHGMSQRGGAVQAHVRIASHAIHSELIPLEQADLIIAVEPLEALRYLEYLRRNRGAIVTSSAAMKNIGDYPPVQEVLARVAGSAKQYVIVDAPAIARIAGSPRAENVVMLGAASAFLPFQRKELLDVIQSAFADKGERAVSINHRAFEMGCDAAATFTAKRARECESAHFDAIEHLLQAAAGAGRTQLFEHEVYQLLAATGSFAPPVHRLVGAHLPITDETLQPFGADRIVIKVVSAQAVHKSDGGGVQIVARSAAAVGAAAGDMVARYRARGAEVAGLLLVDFVEHGAAALGSELFVGLRASREFGPIIAAGLGGVQTEYLATRLVRERAVAIAPALQTSAEAFFSMFAKTAAWELASGQARGSSALVGREALLRCFAAFIEIAQRFGVASAVRDVGLVELEVNPLAVAGGKLIPLDGRGQIGALPQAQVARSARNMARLLEPRSIAVQGVSTHRSNFGRIILNNTQACGFPPDHLYVVKDGGVESIDGAKCVRSLCEIPEPIDLLVAAVSAEQVPKIVTEVLGAGDKVGSVVLVSGGLGETEATSDVPAALRQKIQGARAERADAPIFLGPNSMGVVSRPGKLDTFFIPPGKRAVRSDVDPARLALISQSGAFIITRISNFQHLDPTICLSLGNQLDVSFSDAMNAIGRREDIDCIAAYVEGFNDLDGLQFLRAVKSATESGKTVVFYKAGRTSAGRAAAQGHTASLAGDWDACCAAVRQAGALVATGFDEFERLVELGTTLHDKRVAGRRVAAISNAGCETVGMADNCSVELELPVLSEDTKSRVRQVLMKHGLASLVNARNPLDITPMANDEAYAQSVEALLDAPEIDAAVVGCVPMTAQLLTTPQEITRSGSFAERMIELARRSPKPVVLVVDCSTPYDALIDQIRRAGVPVLRHVDDAFASLGKYLAQRSRLSENSRVGRTRCHRSDCASQGDRT